jgi:hypothetical protein
MPQKALTNHIIAPAHLLEKYRKQKHLMLTAGQAPQLLPATYQQQQQQQGEAQDGQEAADAAGQVEDATAVALAAVAAAIGEQQQHAAGSLAASKSRLNKRKAAAAGDAAAAEEEGAAMDDEQEAAYGAAGDGRVEQLEAAGAEDDMDLDAMLDAAIDKQTAAAAAAAATAGTAVAATAGQDSGQGGLQPAAADAAAPAAAAAGASAASRPNPGRRLGGLSMQHPGLGVSYLGSAARPIVRTTPLVPPPSGQKLLPPPAAGEDSSGAATPFVFGSQGLVPLPGGADDAAIAASMPWLVVGGQGSISRLQQRRLHIVMARLLEHGFVIKQVGCRVDSDHAASCVAEMYV